MKVAAIASFLLVAGVCGHDGHHHGHRHGHDGEHHGHHHHQDYHGDHPHHHHGHGHSHHRGDHNSLSPHTHIAYHHVESACAADVEKLCAVKPDLPETFGDPFLDWALLPMAPPPPELEEMSLMMDKMVESFFSSPSTTITIMWAEEPQEMPPLMVDSMVSKLAEEKHPEEIPELALQLQRYGEILMGEHEEGSNEHRMARRLTEMDANTIQHHVRLPFGCHKNRCLRESLEQNKVSQECATSMRQLEATFVLETELEHRQEMFLGMMWIYIFVLSLLLMLLARKYRANRGQRMLRMRILQAVYSSPELKNKVEEELGESVGRVPPLPYHVLRMMSTGGKDLKRRLRCLKRVHMLVFMCLLVLVFVSPFWVLPVCIVLSVLRVFQLCAVTNCPIENECSCCCCGVSSSDAAAGEVSDEQACCCCCKGTGVCMPSSSSCCNSSDECCGCCCGDSGCCCGDSGSSKKGRGQKHVIPAKNGVYEGVPLQIV